MARLLSILLFSMAAFGQSHPTIPDPKLTPGATNPAVTQATIKQTICKPGYTSTVRNVTEAEKKQVMQRYGLPLTDLHLLEIDHWESLEIGGSNDITNLWPQYYTGPSGYLGARQKDVIETSLHRQVCAGTITLLQAQQEIHSWTTLYLELKLQRSR